jgi:hypothetical protein
VHVDAAIRPERIPHIPISHPKIEPLGVEVAASPALGVGVLGMRAISHDFEEPKIAVDATDVLGRPGASAVDACGNALLWVEREPTFEFDYVLPAVAEVVLIHEFVRFPMGEIE